MVSRTPGVGMAQTCALAYTWVKDNYEIHDNGVVAKSVIYKHYEDFCREQGRPIMETSIFGRVVKQAFPQVQIRRLGGRENLKYYYCGIQAQAHSPYVSDNTNTIRPKRRQRKRVSITDKVEAQKCLHWLYCNYSYDGVSSVRKQELYEHYVQDTYTWSQPLSIQDFTVVIINGFSKLSKRKISSKLQQQGFFVGFKRRQEPLEASNLPAELLIVDETIVSQNPPQSSSLLGYREGSNTPDDEEEYCRSPESEEGSDMSAGTYIEFKDEPLDTDTVPDDLPYDIDEPVDYSVQSLRVKEEPIEPVRNIKTEKLSIDDSISCFRSGTPEGPHSRMMDSPTPSPSPPQKSTRPKPYKPRFHINYQEQEQWDLHSEQQVGNNYSFDTEQNIWDIVLKKWLETHLVKCNGYGVNRDQLFSLYESYCHKNTAEALPMVYFDQVVFKLYPGTVTTMKLPNTTFYSNIRLSPRSEFYGSVEERDFRQALDAPDHQWRDLERPMDISSPPHESHDSPINLEDDEDEDDYSVDKYRETLDDDDGHSIPEVLKDGKYYLKTWLQENFEAVPEACVLKADAYRHYEQYAHSMNTSPFEMNVFGKIVRQVFPKVTIRRLGGRQKPQYHYCGITARPTSSLYSLMGGKDPAQRSRKKEIATDNETTERALEWLRNSYELKKDCVINKTEVFQNYKTYCVSNRIEAVTLNYFGKLVKYCFPEVEVRKFGGRSEPVWYYHGLHPKDPSSIPTTIEDLSETSLMQYGGLSSPLHQSHLQHMSSRPISVPGGTNGSATNSPYGGSPQVLPVSYGINLPYLQGDIIQGSSSFVGGASSLDSRALQLQDHFPRSPELSRAFQERLQTRPPLDGSRMMVRSPDVPPDYFPRSPEGSSAQICRSPASAMITAGHGGHVIDVSSGAPTTLSISSFNQQAIFLSSSPTTKRGAQVVPSQTPPSSLGQFGSQDGSTSLYLVKKIKHQAGPENCTNPFSGRS